MSELSKTERATLQLRLRQLEALDSRRALNGGNEVRAIQALMDRIKVRLNPDPFAALEAEADRIVTTHRDNVEWAAAILKDVA
jgi:hypothetical protein